MADLNERQQEVVDYIKEHLTASLTWGGNFTSPNTMVLELKLDGEVFSKSEVSISIRPEYEG